MPPSEDRALAELKEMRLIVSDIMAEIKDVSAKGEATKLFPYGITSVSVAVKFSGIELSVAVTGPEGTAKPERDLLDKSPVSA